MTEDGYGEVSDTRLEAGELVEPSPGEMSKQTGVVERTKHLCELVPCSYLIALALYCAGNANQMIMQHYNHLGGTFIAKGAHGRVVRLEKIDSEAVVKTEKWTVLPRFVAYRRLISFREDDSERSEAMWRTLVAELQLMLNFRQRPHPNVTRGLSMEFSGLQNTLWHSGIPTILYEYGEHGSMTTFLERTSGIGEGVGSEMKRQLALDVGHGILALHSLGVVHGDLKPDNILIFNDPQRKYIAKVSDFGSVSIWHCKSLVNGTLSWFSPEQHMSDGRQKDIPLSVSIARDVYSYGLLIWSVHLDAKIPFKDKVIGKIYSPESGRPLNVVEKARQLTSSDEDIHQQAQRTFLGLGIDKHEDAMFSAVKCVCLLNPEDRDLKSALKLLTIGGILDVSSLPTYGQSWFDIVYMALNQGHTVKKVALNENSGASPKFGLCYDSDSGNIEEGGLPPRWGPLHTALTNLASESIRDSECEKQKIMAYIRNVVDFDIHQAGRPLLKSEAILIQRACITSLYMLSRYILMVGASLSPEACHYLEKGALMEDQFNLEPELKALLHRFQMLPSAQISSIKISTARSSDWVRQSVRLKPQFSFLLEDLQGGMPDIANLSIGGPSGSDAKTGARNLPGRIFSYFQPDDYCCERGFWTALFNPVHAQLIENLSQNLDNDGAIRETLSETHHQQGMDLKSISLTDLSDTLLHYAAGTGHMVLLVHLVEVIGFPVDTINRLGETALLQASMRGMAAAVRYLLSKGASVSINRVDGYLPVHFVLSFPLEFQREMLDKLTNKSRNLLFAIQTIDLPGQKFSLNFNGPRSVIQSAVALSNLTFLGAVKDLSYEILDPPERELLWGQALGQASSMHLLEVMKFCFEIYPCNGVLSQLLKQALATDVFDRIVWHGPRYHHALAATVHFILSCDENITNSVDCLFYHTAVMNGNLDVLPYLLELNGSMAARGLEMAEDLLPQEPIIPRLVAGGNLGLVAEVLDLLRRAIETLSEDTLGNLTPMLLQSPIPSAIKFETIDKLLERGWKPSVLDFTRMFAILESVMRNYSFSDQESNQLLRAERVRIASRAIQLYRHNLDFLVQIFDTMQIIPKAFSGFKLFLEASKDARVDLDEVFDAFTARERQTLYHKLALSTRRALVSNDRWIGEMTEHVGQYFHRADQLNYLTEEGSSALQLGVMSSNVPFLSAFVGIFSFDDVPPPRKATITCCWEWLEYSEFEYWRTQFNEYQRSYVPDRDSDSVPVRLHHDFDIQRNFSDYRSISRTLEDLRRLSLGYQKCDDQSVWPVRSEDLRTQDFITALACVRMTDALEYQLCGKYIWELPSVEPSMAGLAEHFDYMQDVLSLMDTIFGKYRGVMDYYSSILARDFEKEQLLISEKFSLQGVVTLLYVLGGINVQVGSSGFYDVEEAKIVLGTLHCLFLEDLLQSRRSLVRYPRCSLNFNRKIDFLTQLVGQYQLLEIAKSPKDLDPASKAEPEWDGEDVDQEFAWLDELHATWEDVKKDDHWRQTTLERFTVDLTKLNSALLKMGRVEIFNASRTFEDELIQARGWVEKIRLIHRVRCFEWFQARCEPDRYDDDAKKLREERFKISRVANEILMSLQAEEGVLRSFLYNIAGYVTWRRCKLVFYHVLLQPHPMYNHAEWWYFYHSQRGEWDDALIYVQRILDHNHAYFVILWNNKFPASWKDDFKSMTVLTTATAQEKIEEGRKNRHRLELGAAYCWYARPHPSYYFSPDSRVLQRLDKRDIPQFIEELKTTVLSFGDPQTGFERHILADDWSTSSWVHDDSRLLHWSQLWNT